ncbi:hypothetical protein D1B31_18175 [Neobacillus notoginsengisoli]|uniref:DUF2116 family Zn-ribbon domain-containing protein n=1 Tax=Neobacillus notoginsengisoli TaxID=1578198 RepID=A0A417YQL7_9BACI|nr:hypothetical protein D1B31_18175 [Neobacillus notoginsengisoli]
MSEFVRDGHRRCMSCGRPYMNSHRTPICGNCAESNVRRIRKTRRNKRNIIIISFLLFPIGFMIYFLWKDNKPHYAKPALYSAITFLCLYGVFGFLPYLIDM